MWWLGHALEASEARLRRTEGHGMNGEEEGEMDGYDAHAEGVR